MWSAAADIYGWTISSPSRAVDSLVENVNRTSLWSGDISPVGLLPTLQSRYHIKLMRMNHKMLKINVSTIFSACFLDSDSPTRGLLY